MIDTFQIKNVASSVLNNLIRTSYSEEGFSEQQTNAIAEAISEAIAEYDKQHHDQ